MSGFTEINCTFTHGEHSYTSGGAYLWPGAKGKLRGILYARPKTGEVTTWHGDLQWLARYGHEWRGNMGDVRQSVYVQIDGRRFYGVYYKSGSDVVRVREMRAA